MSKTVKIIIILIIALFSISCEKINSNNEAHKKIKLPSKELVDQRKMQLKEFKNKLLSQLNRNNKFIALQEHLSPEFMYYVGKYIPNKKEITISIDDDKALQRLSNIVDMKKVKIVLEEGKLSSGAETGSIFLSNDERYPYIDFIYDKKSDSWKIDVIRYETE